MADLHITGGDPIGEREPEKKETGQPAGIIIPVPEYQGEECGFDPVPKDYHKLWMTAKIDRDRLRQEKRTLMLAMYRIIHIVDRVISDLELEEPDGPDEDTLYEEAKEAEREAANDEVTP